MDDPFGKDFEPGESFYVPPRRAPQLVFLYVLIGALALAVIALLSFVLSERVPPPTSVTQANTQAPQTRNSELAEQTLPAQLEQTRVAGDGAQTRVAQAEQTLDAVYAQQTRVVGAPQAQQTLDTLYAQQTRVAEASQTSAAIAFAETRAVETQQAIVSFAAQTRQARDTFYAAQTRTAQSKSRARYWIECDPDGTARIYFFTDPWSWPEVKMYASEADKIGEGPIQGRYIQPKIVNPFKNKGLNSVDYRITARWDNFQETMYIHYRYPSGCSPARP